MIWNKTAWQEELYRTADRMQRRRSQKRWSERSHMLVERDTFTGFFTIRRLIEANNLSDSVRHARLPVLAYPSMEEPVTYWNYHRVEELYDLRQEMADERHVSVLYCCNQVIHSYQFWTMREEEGGLFGILFCSERERNRHLLRLRADDMIGLFRAAASDDIDEMEMTWNGPRGDYDLVRAVNHRVPPERRR